MAKKMKDVPIPTDLLAMTLEQLEAESERHDSGDIRTRRERIANDRDEAQAELEELSQRRHDINRAMIAKMETIKKG